MASDTAFESEILGKAADSRFAARAAEPLGAVAENDLHERILAVVEADREVARAQAKRAALIDQTRMLVEATAFTTVIGWSERSTSQRNRLSRQVLVTELAAALHLPEGTVDGLIGESETLCRTLPGTMSALRAGDISYRHAQHLIEQAGSLATSAAPDETPADAAEREENDVELMQVFENEVLPYACRLTPSRFRQKAVRVRERMHPESITARRERAAADRAVTFEPARDGMGWLHLYAEAPLISAAHDRITQAAIGLQHPGETRTLTQLRADVMTDVLLGDHPAPREPSEAATRGDAAAATDETEKTDDGENGAGADRASIWSRIRGRVMVTVPVQTLLGLSEEPASLDGYGPIDPETARRICAEAPSFTRLLTHPETGAVLSVGRNSYTVPADLKRTVQLRDGTCRFPGCSRNAVTCDLDHTLDWAHQGETALDNLACLCPKHHALKHATRWRVAQQRDGTLDWTAPSGLEYSTEPQMSIRNDRPPPSRTRDPDALPSG